MPSYSLLAIALDQLTLGSAHLGLALTAETPPDFKEGEEHLDRAVVGFRQAGEEEFVSRGLLVRATLRRFRDSPAVSFEEASGVFFDPLARIFDDPVHSQLETREIIIGHSSADRLLLVCFTESRPRVIRIFSARQATKKERKDYEENIL